MKLIAVWIKSRRFQALIRSLLAFIILTISISLSEPFKEILQVMFPVKLGSFTIVGDFEIDYVGGLLPTAISMALFYRIWKNYMQMKWYISGLVLSSAISYGFSWSDGGNVEGSYIIVSFCSSAVALEMIFLSQSLRKKKIEIVSLKKLLCVGYTYASLSVVLSDLFWSLSGGFVGTIGGEDIVDGIMLAGLYSIPYSISLYLLMSYIMPSSKSINIK